jgi:hypothetical protein
MENLVPVKTAMKWLVECENECRAEDVRWFLRQFQKLIHNQLVQTEELSMTGDAIVDLTLRSDEDLDAALRIGDQYQRIKERVFVRVLSHVQIGLERWGQQSFDDWELISEWQGGNWIRTPSNRLLKNPKRDPNFPVPR